MKKGDLVFLKSGSPLLTVEDIDIDGSVEVTWFHGGQCSVANFPEVCLTYDEPNLEGLGKWSVYNAKIS